MAALLHLALSVWVVSKIHLGAHKDEWNSWCVVLDFWVPLGSNVVEGSRGDHREADEEHISLWVGKWSQSVIVLLASSIPQTKVDWFAINHYVCRVVIKHSWDVLSWESIGGVGDEKACLTDSSITIKKKKKEKTKREEKN
jgi:hypothetical protein